VQSTTVLPPPPVITPKPQLRRPAKQAPQPRSCHSRRESAFRLDPAPTSSLERRSLKPRPGRDAEDTTVDKTHLTETLPTQRLHTSPKASPYLKFLLRRLCNSPKGSPDLKSLVRRLCTHRRKGRSNPKVFYSKTLRNNCRVGGTPRHPEAPLQNAILKFQCV
jgi:hypothetical protein